MLVPHGSTTQSDIDALDTSTRYIYPTTVSTVKTLEFKIKVKSTDNNFSVIMDPVYSYQVVALTCSNNEGITGNVVDTVDYSIDGGLVTRR